MFHNGIHFLLCWGILKFLSPSMRPSHTPSMAQYVTKVVPCASAGALDLGLSNTSLKLISLSFYTMVKSGAPMFVLFFAFLFKIEKPNLRLISVILVIALGVCLMVIDEAKFDWIGYMAVQFATIASGLRWALTQLLLDKQSMGMNNPVATMFYLSPCISVCLLIAYPIMEGVTTPFSAIFSSVNPFKVILYLIFGGLLSFCMILLEYGLICVTSVVTLSVVGILKEILTISLSHYIFGDTFSAMNISGLVISIVGIAMYNYIKIQSLPGHIRSSSDDSDNQGWDPLIDDEELNDMEREFQLRPMHS
jgi:solute carrier family 35 protein C2